MAERDVTVALSSDTSGFSEGIQQAKKILLELNKTLVDSQSTLKAAAKELNTYEKEQKKLQEEMSKSGNDTEENRKKMALLTEKIKEQKEKVAQLRTEQTEIRGQISRATTALKNETNAVEEAAKKNNNLSGAVSETSEELKKQGQEAENASEGFTVLKGAISNLVSDALRVAVDEFKEMSVSAEQSLNSLRVKTGMSAEAVGELKDEMYDIYKNNFGDSLTDVADKLALVAQNIDESDPSKLKDITEKAIGLSDAFGSDFEENLRGVNGLMVNMGLTADEAFDLIAKGSQNGLDKTHELTDNLAEYSQLWGQAGFSAEEMFSILQNGLDSGAYTLDKVNDYVGEFGKALADGRMAENITSFSRETQNLFNAWKNGGATTADVFKSTITDLSNMENQQKALTIATETWGSLGEDNAMSVITALNNVNDTYSDVAGTMQEINDIQYNDVGSQVEALGRQFEVDILQPIVEGITPAVKDVISWTSEHLPEVTTALSGLVTTVVAFKATTAVSSFLGSIISGFTQLTSAIGATTAAQAAGNAVAAANPYIALASAILGIVTAATVWVNTNYKVVDGLGDINKLTEELDKNATQQRQSVEAEIEQIKSLNSVYDELRGKTNLTSEEKETLTQVSEELAGKLGLEESALQGVDGKYKDLTKSIDDYIEKAHQRVELSIVESNWETTAKELENTKKEFEQTLKDKGYSEDGVLDAAGRAIVNQYKEKTDLLEEKIKGYKEQYDSILLGTQESQETMTVSEALNAKNASDATDKATKSIKSKTTATKNDTNSVKDATKSAEDYSEAMSDMSAKTNAVTKAEEQYNESGRFTVSTIQAVIDKYPELEEEVNQYILGIIDGKELIQSMKNVYQDDLNSYIGVISQKASNSNTFYNQLINANASFVNEAKRQYGVDLLNFQNLQEAKAAMVAVAESRINSGWLSSSTWGEKFSLAGDLSKFNSVVRQYGSANNYLATKEIEKFLSSSISATTSFKSFFGDLDKKTGGGSGGGSGGSSSNKDNKYELASEAYNHLVDKRIEKIEKEAEAAEKAKDRKIAAIDAEIEARKRLNEDADRQAELDEINAKLEYDRLSKLDRRELERKRQDLLNEQTQVEWERMMSDRKNNIQNGYDSQKDSYSQAIDSLQRAAISAENYFSRLAGTQTSSQIVNNNSDTRNIQIIANALSDQQMFNKFLNAIYSK